MSQYLPEALGGNQITGSTVAAACLVAVGVCTVGVILNRMNLGVISTPLGIAITGAAGYGAYCAYAYTTHTQVHTEVDNALVKPGYAHPYVYGGAVAAGLAAAYLVNGGNQVAIGAY